MPILQICSLPPGNDVNVSEILTTLCTSVAETIGYEPQHIWANWQDIRPGHYAVGEKTGNNLQKDQFSPIVQILSFEGKPAEKVAQMLETTAVVLSRLLNIDRGNVFVYYHELRSGEVFDGGNVVYKK